MGGGDGGVCDYSKLFTSVGAGEEQVWDKQCTGHSGPTAIIDYFHCTLCQHLFVGMCSVCK